MKCSDITNGSGAVSENLELRKTKISGCCGPSLASFMHGCIFHLDMRQRIHQQVPKEWHTSILAKFTSREETRKEGRNRALVLYSG